MLILIPATKRDELKSSFISGISSLIPKSKTTVLPEVIINTDLIEFVLPIPGDDLYKCKIIYKSISSKNATCFFSNLTVNEVYEKYRILL